MIRKAKFSNFYSFNKEQKISFIAKKKKTYDYYQSESEDQITKIAGFIGGNASGKTNIMRFFSFLSFFVCRKVEGDSPLIADIAFKTFFNNDKQSNFFIEFEIKNSIFSYDFSIKNNIITNETLYIKKIQKNARQIKIFSRQLNSIESLNSDYFENISIDALPKIRGNVSTIAFIKYSQYNVDIINNIYDYFLGFKTNINERGQNLLNHPGYQIDTLDIYSKDKEFKKEVDDFICRFDVGLNGFEVKKEKKEKGFSVSVQGIHATKVKNNKLDFSYESSGTRSLFFTMINILSALKHNNIVIIDEIESGFHPEALNKLVSYFIDKNKNKNAQIIFSSHSFGFMNKLDMHQIFLTEKNSNGESSVYRLNKVERIRTDENFLAKYMTGAYGAFPKIRV